ncbi:unnamed protein product, partial [Prorocentrum cordatum]
APWSRGGTCRRASRGRRSAWRRPWASPGRSAASWRPSAPPRPAACGRSTTSSSTECSSQRSWHTHWSSRSLRGLALTSWWWSPEGSTRIRACVSLRRC